FRTGTRTAHEEGCAAAKADFVALEVILDHRPVRDAGRGLINAVFANVGDHADDFAPLVFAGYADALAEGVLRRVPIFASEVLRNDADVAALVGVGPAEVASGDERRAGGGEESRADINEA